MCLSIASIGVIVAVASTAVTSFLTCLSIRQTRKHYRETNRPSISPSYEVICTDKLYTIFKLKNYGNMGASITAFDCSLASNNQFVLSQMGDLTGIYFAPGQAYLFWFKTDEITENHADFNITYSASDGRTFSEHFTLKIRCGRGSYRTNAPGANIPSPLLSSMQEIAEQLLSNR